ncbi:MAG: lactate racemase domain-containing protein, partial [Chloroflexota bacterium]
MAKQQIRLRVGAWFTEKEVEASFPADWEVVECRMAGHDRPALGDEAMRAALQNPIGSPRLRDLAHGKHEAIILFDDLPKPTPTGRIAPFVIEELHAGGIGDEHIRFVCAPGSHRPLIYPEFVAKLGEEIVQKYPVYNHHIYENLVDVGTTSAGIPVHVNREFAECDLRVGIGSLFPHPLAGFGGGGKLIMPGISGIETIDAHHKMLQKSPTTGLGKLEGNEFRLQIEEAARLAGLQFKVDAVLNNRREVVGLFAGDFVAEHREGAKLAREVYYTEPVKDADVLVVNGYPDESQFVRSTWCIPLSLREGGDAVLITFSHEGQNLHQWTGRFGTNYGGRNWAPGGRARTVAKARRLFVWAPFLSKVDRMELGAPEKVIWCKEWAEIEAALTADHGAGTKVGVYPYASTQMNVV